jgi:hypothetical protein
VEEGCSNPTPLPLTHSLAMQVVPVTKSCKNHFAQVSDSSSMVYNQLNPWTRSSAQPKKRKRMEVGLEWMSGKTKNLNKVEYNPKPYVLKSTWKWFRGIFLQSPPPPFLSPILHLRSTFCGEGWGRRRYYPWACKLCTTVRFYSVFYGLN